jgi:hypothetical protein
MIQLTEHQQQELCREDWPPRVLDPRTRETFVLLPTELYERARALLEAEEEIAAVREMYPLVSRILEEGEATDDSKESA